MGSRYPSHQLSNGLFVSGRPEQPKERTPTMSSTAMPYTGGDIKKSGELGKMFDIPIDGSKSRKSGPLTGAPSRTGSFGGAGSQSGSMMPNAAPRAGYTSGPLSSGGLSTVSLKKSNSGPLNKHGEPIKKTSGPQSGGVSRQNSGNMLRVLAGTGLITSGPVSSGPLNSSGASRKISGSLDSASSFKIKRSSIAQNAAVTTISEDDDYSFWRNLPKRVLCAVASIFMWNACRGEMARINFIARYSDVDLRTTKTGQYVKVSGVVTCGNVPLESSFQRVPRCVYTSTRLFEYRGLGSKPVNPSHSPFTWGLRSSERRVADFYISDFQSGLRALVKTGNGATVTPLVDDSFVVDLNPANKELSPEFMRWLGEKNLSSDDRVMRLKEGYIKEGSTVSVMGVIQRNENVIMIVPPAEPFATGCQWTKCILPTRLNGIVLRSEDTSNEGVIPV